MQRNMWVAVGLMMAAPAFAQGMPGEVQKAYAGIEGNVLKAADKMPPEGYTYKPTPDVRTFARVVNHVTEVQFRICGAPTKTVPPETAEKAVIVEALKASFAECDKAYAALTEANMTEVITVGPFTRSRLGMMWGNVSHDNEQYATLALYLRLKGLAPPSSEK